MRHFVLFLLFSLTAPLSAQCLLEWNVLSTYCLAEADGGGYAAEVLVQGATPESTGLFIITTPEGDVFGEGTYPGSITLGQFQPGEEPVLLLADTATLTCFDTLQFTAPECLNGACSGFAIDAQPASPIFCESGEVWDLMPVNGAYPVYLEVSTLTGASFYRDSLLTPGVISQFFDANDLRVVLTDANGCRAETVISVQPHFCANIQGRSWLDDNGNGLRDGAEITGVQAGVTLFNDRGEVVENTQTDQNGNFFFFGLLEGSYTLQFFSDDQRLFATQSFAGDDVCADSDLEEDAATTIPFFVAAGSSETCIDAGWVSLAACESFFISASLSVGDFACGEFPDILVEQFSENYPSVIYLLDLLQNPLDSMTVNRAEPVIFNVDAARTYLVRGVDSFGCTGISTVNVEAGSTLDVFIEQSNALCGSPVTAFLTALAEGADPANLSYLWSTGETTRSITNLTLNTNYTVIVTDGSTGCRGAAAIVTISDLNDSLSVVSFPEPFLLGCGTDTVLISPDTVLEGYTYRWFGPLNQFFEGPSFRTTMAGTYVLEAFSPGGCLITGYAQVATGSLDTYNFELLAFPADSFCTTQNCLYLRIQGPDLGERYIDVTWQTPDPMLDSVANMNPYTSFCSELSGLYRVTVTTECDTFSQSVFLEDPRNCTSVSGSLWVDEAANCALDAEDTPVPDYVVMLTSDLSGEVYYAITDANGIWQLDLPEGSYTAAPSLAPASPFGTCVPAPSFTLGGTPVTGVNVFLPAVVSCPQLTTSATMPFLRRCFPGNAWVDYENRGSATALNAEVTVTLDDFFLDVSTVPAAASQSGQTYTFNVGDVPPFGSGRIYFQFTVSCESDLGQSHCLEVSVIPDEPCNPDPNWNGALVAVDAVGCTGDSVSFRVTNIGVEQMTIPLSYVIVEDGIMLRPAPFVNGQLNPDEAMEILLPANGSTYHLITNQEPNAPGDPAPTAVLQGCSTTGNGDLSTGFTNALNLASGPLGSTTVCRENVGSYDPNDKNGYPLGYGGRDLIPQGTRLDYAIRFQNTGTDTAFTVVIRDTLPETLDLATLKMEASSHPYVVTLDTHRVLSFVFENILLPDSATNLAASQGVVSFSIDHAADLANGDEIFNEAAIYFDFNEPVITNLSRHEIDTEGLPTGVREARLSQVPLMVYPNPSEGMIKVLLPDAYSGQLLVTDLYGRKLAAARYENAASGWDLRHLSSGYYVLVLTDANGLVRGRTGFVVTK